MLGCVNPLRKLHRVVILTCKYTRRAAPYYIQPVGSAALTNAWERRFRRFVYRSITDIVLLYVFFRKSLTNNVLHH